jgi:hypothetical protein
LLVFHAKPVSNLDFEGSAGFASGDGADVLAPARSGKSPSSAADRISGFPCVPQQRAFGAHMPQPHTDSLPFFSRLALALGSLFRILGDGAYAARVAGLDRSAPATVPVAPARPAPAPAATPPDAALQLLGLLQREARLIDFCEEDLAGHADADIGAAARLVHDSCRKLLREHFTIAPVRPEAEGSRVTLPAGFDTTALRLTGNVVGAGPYAGTLSHRGWRVTDSRLPKLSPGHQVAVLAPAEVEL